MKSQKKVIGLKIETTPGTPVTLNAATDYLAAVDFKWGAPAKPVTDTMEYTSGGYGSRDTFMVSLTREAGFTLPIVGGGMPLGTNYPPAWLALIRACGHAVTVNAATSVVINPVSSGEEAATFKANEDGFERLMSFVRGNLKWVFEEGKVGRMSGDLMGLYSTPADQAAPTPTLPTILKPVGFSKINTVVTLGAGFNPKCSRVEIDGGRSHAYRNMAGAEDIVPQDCRPTATLRMELPTATAKNVYQQLESTAEEGLTVVHGVTPGNIWTFDADRASLVDLSEQPDRGVIVVTARYELKPTSAGNDHYSITLT